MLWLTADKKGGGVSLGSMSVAGNVRHVVECRLTVSVLIFFSADF